MKIEKKINRIFHICEMFTVALCFTVVYLKGGFRESPPPPPKLKSINTTHVLLDYRKKNIRQGLIIMKKHDLSERYKIIFIFIILLHSSPRR